MTLMSVPNDRPQRPDPSTPPAAGAGGRSLASHLMWRASTVALLTLLIVTVVGIWTAQHDIQHEMRAALALARTLQPFSQAQDGPALVARLNSPEGRPPGLRHLQLGLRDAEGQSVFRCCGSADPESWAASTARWLSRWSGNPELPAVIWTVPQRSGPPWVLTLTADADSERREALSDLGDVLLLVGLGTAALLCVLAWSVQRSLAPLRDVAQALGHIRPGRTAAARDLQFIRLREIDQVTSAVRTLAEALDRTETERRLLAQKLQSLQEAERSRLAGELHDEWGQRLTSLWLDASWLARRLADDPELTQACHRMGQQCARLQTDLRQRLRSLAPRDLGAGEVRALQDALQDLVAGWTAEADEAGRPRLQVQLRWDDRRAPQGPEQAPAGVNAELLLAIYRLSQEGLTNVARHADARHATLSVRISNDRLEWTLEDDGCGIADAAAALRRGTGLASLRERAWSHGSELELAETRPGDKRPGLRLTAAFALEAAPSPTGGA